jgi:hypothetical protein
LGGLRFPSVIRFPHRPLLSTVERMFRGELQSGQCRRTRIAAAPSSGEEFVRQDVLALVVNRRLGVRVPPPALSPRLCEEWACPVCRPVAFSEQRP